LEKELYGILEQRLLSICKKWCLYFIFNLILLKRIIKVIIQTHDQSLPLRFIKMVLLLLCWLIFCTAYKYRICIADEEFKIYEVYFIILAHSTSAWADIMVATDNRFWIAADCKFFCTSGCKITSTLDIKYLL